MRFRPLLTRLGLIGGSRRAKLIWTVSSVLVLSAVVYGGAALSAPSSPFDSRRAERQLGDSEYSKALSALNRGDVEAAESLALKALAANPGHDRARSLLDQVRREYPSRTDDRGSLTDDDSDDDQDPAPPADDPDGDDPSEPAVDVDTGYTEPFGNLVALLPGSIDGYARGSVEEGKTTAILSVRPAAPGSVSVVVFSVIDQGSTDAARRFVSTINDTAYPHDAKQVKVRDIPGRFGTDDLGHASTAFSRGRYAFEVVATTGGDPGALLDLVVKLAAEFPAASL